MTRIARTVVIALLLTAALGSSGCGWSRRFIHTWTETYADYPASAFDQHSAPPQGNPIDG
jgi:hypothetical protein